MNLDFGISEDIQEEVEDYLSGNMDESILIRSWTSLMTSNISAVNLATSEDPITSDFAATLAAQMFYTNVILHRYGIDPFDVTTEVAKLYRRTSKEIKEAQKAAAAQQAAPAACPPEECASCESDCGGNMDPEAQKTVEEMKEMIGVTSAAPSMAPAPEAPIPEPVAAEGSADTTHIENLPRVEAEEIPPAPIPSMATAPSSSAVVTPANDAMAPATEG